MGVVRVPCLLPAFAVLFLIAATPISEGAPVLAPDLRLCQERSAVGERCCPPSPGNSTASIKRFDLASVPRTMRVRRPAHLLDASEWEQLNVAYQRMRALPDDDPRSLLNQARIHCAYCTPALPLPWIDPTDNQTALLDVHGSWMFLPWHRFFVYFHERILASLVGNESLALPYWNWDNQDEATLPGAVPTGYADPESALYDVNRNPNRARPAIANLSDLVPAAMELRDLGPQANTAALREQNLAFTQLFMITTPTTKRLFHGSPFRFGDPPWSPRAAGGKGLMEDTIHGAVHSWISNTLLPSMLDMGNPAAAAADPIFFSHHSNIDRLWVVWKSMREWRGDIRDPDFLDSEFVFFDELGEAVVVTIEQSLRPEQDLRYVFEPAPNGGDRRWMRYVPRSCSPFRTRRERRDWVRTIPELDPAGYTLVYGSPVAFRVTRPRREPGSGSAARFQEVLVVEATMNSSVAPGLVFVYLMLPTDAVENPRDFLDCVEFVGFGNDFSAALPVPDRALFRVGLGRKLEQLGAVGLTDIVVMMAPGLPHQEGFGVPLFVHNVRIDLEPV